MGEFADSKNYEVYVVGGFVRDRILGRSTDFNEIDMTVIGNGIRFAEELSSHLKTRDIVIYRNFGTALINYGNVKLEFVGTRKESYKQSSRKPSVVPGTFEDDIQRRDFTINTLSFSINKNSFGEIIDRFNGFEDIKNKIIRTPLDPKITFSDDPLRIMRAFRFASQLDFNLDDNVFNSAKELAERIKIVAIERVNDEFFKIILSDKPSIGLSLMFKSGVMQILFPEIADMAGVEQKQEWHHKDVFWHTLEVLDNIATETKDLWLRLAALFHDIAKPVTKAFDPQSGWTFHGHEVVGSKMIKELFLKYKFPMHKCEYISKLVYYHLRPMVLAEEVTDSAIRRLVVGMGDDLEDLFILCRADITSKNPNKVKANLQNYERVLQKIHYLIEKDKLRAFQSPIRGEEIMQMFNLPPSKGVGIIKELVEEAILDGIIPNDYESAKKYLNENYEKLSNLVSEYRNK
ncbi:MAG: CCA tRNA nucleotidyltransferase [Ignavibacteria bacterium]|nr:CCA tRNA nucleotidyltransferase [Ignavibacteria bacterium]